MFLIYLRPLKDYSHFNQEVTLISYPFVYKNRHIKQIKLTSIRYVIPGSFFKMNLEKFS